MKKINSDNIIQITDPDIEKYSLQMTTQESESVRALVGLSNRELEFTDMLSGKLMGQLLKILIQITGACRVLEIGTFTGYSALMMAEALPEDGELITIEMNIRYQALAEKHFNKFDSNQKITLLKGDARELIEELVGTFNMVFLDADKISYREYYEKSIPILKPGGFLVVDNVLWSGSVLNPDNPKSKALDDFNRFVAADDRAEQVLLPICDGVTIIQKK